MAQQALQRYEDHFEVGEDPFGETYYWLTGAAVNEDRRPDSDLVASEQGLVTITPMRIDLTDRDLLETMGQWNLRL